MPQRGQSTIRAMVAYEDAYVQPLIVSALKSLIPEDKLDLTTDMPASTEGSSFADAAPESSSNILQIVSYESIDFEYAASHARTCLINSYMIRKALIRKHYLSVTVDHLVAKNPESPLGKHFKRSEAFEVDYAEFLDDALVEAFDLRESMDHNAEIAQSSDGSDADEARKDWWILKPGMSDRGQGIRLFSTMEELQAIFDQWDEDQPDSDDEEYEGADGGAQDRDADAGEGEAGDYITTSHLRHFVAQPYIHPPLLLEADPRKFHIRTYVLATGGLTVHVYKHMLALFAAKPYLPPWAHSATDIDSFLTNTCLQEQRQRNSSGATTASGVANSVRRFWDLPLAPAKLQDIFSQICSVTGEAFEAAATAMPIHFQALPNAFEVFGLDFMVDASGTVWLLEANAFPDFKQTGSDLEEIVAGFWKGVVRTAVLPFFGLDDGVAEDEDMVTVRAVDLGRR
ncbi:hypothetical protein HIM_06022 [Hirsutella minnesotensis 3608]|uniref:Tubulin-tyrosine ligase n=1 Tax=Hirsutella minnesotensis 3608 TaxID=1043627 RepID=A0A0F7ZZR3_9HYPO|nr:hypothetical protein HIM_06022 [Hirsutella minnesotensis 3608]